MRFVVPDVGGARSPRFVLARPLAFEARLEALADPEHRLRSAEAYLERHLRAALERHIAETVLCSLTVDPNPSRQELDRQTEMARRILAERVGGSEAIMQAARAEGLAGAEVTLLLRRQARASLYLHRMVAPMLTPSRAELREVFFSEDHPYRGMSFDRIEPALLRWVVSSRLAEALDTYYQNVRQRLEVTFLRPWP